jgi:hypothetical protein
MLTDFDTLMYGKELLLPTLLCELLLSEQKNLPGILYSLYQQENFAGAAVLHPPKPETLNPLLSSFVLPYSWNLIFQQRFNPVRRAKAFLRTSDLKHALIYVFSRLHIA